MDEKNRDKPQGALVFDLDGTLTDTSEDIAHSINYMREKLALDPLPTKEVLKAVGKGAPYLLRTLLGFREDEMERLRELAPVFQRHYLAHQGERSALYPGMRDAVVELSEEYDLYVLSNKPDVATKNEVKRNGISQYFREVWGAGVLSDLKPHPVGIETAMALSQVPRSKVLMIGDLTVDIQTGINAKVRTIHVTWGFGTLTADDPQPTVEAGSAAELVARIHELI